MQAAAKLRTTQTFVSKCERGERRGDVIELNRFAKLYGRPLAWFVEEKESSAASMVFPSSSPVQAEYPARATLAYARVTRSYHNAREALSRDVAIGILPFEVWGSSTSGRTSPAEHARDDTGGIAYAMFYRTLGKRRTVGQFRNSLKNARDMYDSHLASGRVGWRDPAVSPDGVHQPGALRPPSTLGATAAKVMSVWQCRSDQELWQAVHPLIDMTVTKVPNKVLKDLEAALDVREPDRTARTEGGEKMVISSRAERDPSLRADALKIHGTACCVCGFSFGSFYGKWGEGFAEVHHVYPLGNSGSEKRTTDPTSDLRVICANCHRMMHRKRGTVLTVEELQAKIAAQRAAVL